MIPLHVYIKTLPTKFGKCMANDKYNVTVNKWPYKLLIKVDEWSTQSVTCWPWEMVP